VVEKIFLNENENSLKNGVDLVFLDAKFCEFLS